MKGEHTFVTKLEVVNKIYITKAVCDLIQNKSIAPYGTPLRFTYLEVSQKSHTQELTNRNKTHHY